MTLWLPTTATRAWLDAAAARGRFEAEGWRIRKNGSRFWASVVVTALREAGALQGFAKIARDVTQRKLLEDELRRRAEQLAEAARRKDETDLDPRPDI